MIVHGLYLRKGLVYIPTTAKVPSMAYREIDPISVVPVTEIEALRIALKEIMARGNPILENSSSGIRPEPAILKYAGVKSFSAFARGAQPWTIVFKNGVYEIRGQRKRPDRGWEQDPNNIIVFPVGTSDDAVIEEMIQILQQWPSGRKS
jgi:hypothetical protein